MNDHDKLEKPAVDTTDIPSQKSAPTDPRLPGEFRPGDQVQPVRKTRSIRVWTVVGRVRPGHDSWFVLDEKGLRTCVSGSELQLYRPTPSDPTFAT
jgi:hypothetical protein